MKVQTFAASRGVGCSVKGWAAEMEHGHIKGEHSVGKA